MRAAISKTRPREKNAGAMLDAIRQILGLSESDLADLFHVRAPSIYGWREAGIPDARRASVERILDLATVLRRELKATRIAQIVRTPDDWLGGKTILETIRDEGPEAVYAYLHRLFSYTGT